MPNRKEKLITGNYYHIYSKGVLGSTVFKNHQDYQRMMETFYYYKDSNAPCQFSVYKTLRKTQTEKLPSIRERKPLVSTIAYCLMPNHIHFLFKQLQDNGISKVMECLLKSYACYFNGKHDRKGILWGGRFGNVQVKSDEQLLHLTRYIHLNPVTAYLVEKAEVWPYSSYKEYLRITPADKDICSFRNILRIEPARYNKYVEERKNDQRHLAGIKKLLLDA